MSDLVVRASTPADAPGIRRLFARIFGHEMTEEEWSWKFERNPDGWFGVIALLDGAVVGNYAGWGVRFRIDGREELAYAVGDVATDPAVRTLGGRSNVFRRITDAFYEEVEGNRRVPFCFGFPGGRHVRITQRVVGTRTLFDVVERRVPCEAFPPPPPDASCADFVDERFDALWESVSQERGTVMAVRDRARVNWRFHARPNRWYRMVFRESSGGLRGWAALSVSGENALVADYLLGTADPNDLLLLFAAVAAEGARLGAKRLVFWESPRPDLGALGKLPAETARAGFPLDARIVDERAVLLFRENGHLVPSLYDLV